MVLEPDEDQAGGVLVLRQSQMRAETWTSLIVSRGADYSASVSGGSRVETEDMSPQEEENSGKSQHWNSALTPWVCVSYNYKDLLKRNI